MAAVIDLCDSDSEVEVPAATASTANRFYHSCETEKLSHRPARYLAQCGLSGRSVSTNCPPRGDREAQRQRSAAQHRAGLAAASPTSADTVLGSRVRGDTPHQDRGIERVEDGSLQVSHIEHGAEKQPRSTMCNEARRLASRDSREKPCRTWQPRRRAYIRLDELVCTVQEYNLKDHPDAVRV